jgi:hypothetical protein
MITSRRSLLKGLFAAPAIIAADRLMPVKAWREGLWPGTRFVDFDAPPRLLWQVSVNGVWYDAHPEMGRSVAWVADEAKTIRSLALRALDWDGNVMVTSDVRIPNGHDQITLVNGDTLHVEHGISFT